jgi:hypothetical protein
MRRELRIVLGGLAVSATLAAAPAHADDAGSAPRAATTTTGAATAAATGAAQAQTQAGSAPAARKAGPLEAGAGAVMPPGHPAVPADPHAGGDAAAAGAADPREGADPHASGGAQGMGEAPEDGTIEDPSIAKGSIELHIMDPTGKPLARTDVTLGVIYNSVAKGESRKRIAAVTDDLGVARFSELDTGSGVAYRPMVLKDGATFSVTPFQLGQRGMRALLHVYPVTNDITQTLVVSQSMIYVEVKDDRVQIQQALKIYNFGRNTWVPPADLLIALPPTFTAFATQQGMTDVGVDAVPTKGVKLRGSFSPGQHVIEFKWQLPYTGDADVKFDVGMPPHLAAARVLAPAAKGMGMAVDGFEPTKTSTDGMGQRALVTEKQIRRDEPPITSLKVAISGLPTEGPGKVIATFLALSGLVAGVVLGSRRRLPRDTKRERQQLLAALEGLELSHRDGTIGPKTYERARRELIDDIARTFAAEPKPVKNARKKTAAASV